MFEKILIANRGDQPSAGCAVNESRKCHFIAETKHV